MTRPATTGPAPSPVATVPAADSATALRHFEARLAFETDCWDVHASLAAGAADFVLLDVRSPDLFAAGHVPGALNLPHGKITARRMSDWPENTLFVVYCAGPHCNGANKAAVRLARLGRPVKEMIGGVTGWLDEGFALAT
jgi:rhodanese-related sulfurtransferase